MQNVQEKSTNQQTDEPSISLKFKVEWVEVLAKANSTWSILYFQINKMDFSSKSFITTAADLEAYVKKCKRCFQSLNHGNHIITHVHLEKTNISKLTTRKLCFIINSESMIQGHWVALLVIRAPVNVAVYLDSQNLLKQSKPSVYRNIEYFCKKNRLKLIDKSFRMQNLNHKNCGYHALHFIAKFCHLSMDSFNVYLHALRNNPNKMRELSMYLFVKSHFR